MTMAQQLEASGIEKGKAEAQQTIAKRCIQQGLSLETISQITGLSLEAIKALNTAAPH